MREKPAVLIVHRHLAPLAPVLGSSYTVYCLWEAPPVEAARTVRAVVVDGSVTLDTKILDGLPNLGLIACLTVGYEGIDLKAARERGLQVSYSPGSNFDDVADHAMGLILASRREIVGGDRMVRDGEWSEAHRPLSRSLVGAQVGIVGLGRIGQAVARRCEPFGLRVRWWGPRPKPDQPWARAGSLIELAQDSDILVLCVRADEDNRHLIDSAVIEAVGPRGLLVNVARGALVDEDALIERLKSGALGGAALDVYEQEPTPKARWADVPNVILTPHAGGATQHAVQTMVGMLLGNLANFFGGRPLATPVED